MKNTKFIEKIYTKKTIKKTKDKFLLLGNDCKINALEFLSVRFIISIILFFLLIYINKYGYIVAPLVTIAFYFSFEYLVIDINIKKREKKLEYEALFYFEVLTLSLETGRNLKGALELTSRNIDSELSKEFAVALKEMDYGKTLNEALNDLKKRIPSDTINNVILNITQSNIFGGSIIETLYNQVDYLRDKRFLSAKEVINKMPIKISVISVIFFIPILLLLLISPIIIDLF